MFGYLAGVLVHSVWSFKVQLGINVWIVIYAQGLYVIRLWKFGRHFHKFWPWLVFLIMATALGSMGILMIYAICITSDFSDVSNITTEIHIVFATVAAADFVIALMMCYYLHKSRVATNFSTTASLLLGLIRLVVASGLITSACSLFTLISYIVWPETSIFLGIDFILPKRWCSSWPLTALLWISCLCRLVHESTYACSRPSLS
ncbi:hypothetical protein ARMGADRAFT_611014 [Armillaria gallica]|uniref:DUF6534 domain-containing protein n=1 Tax=Armillaria gallica TaxID=47427 RepID=A0A2H3CM03_ARMGA|nr:hypothetical protein ARMGADRAFT_611014 [Armillaria gallica]